MLVSTALSGTVADVEELLAVMTFLATQGFSPFDSTMSAVNGPVVTADQVRHQEGSSHMTVPLISHHAFPSAAARRSDTGLSFHEQAVGLNMGIGAGAVSRLVTWDASAVELRKGLQMTQATERCANHRPGRGGCR